MSTSNGKTIMQSWRLWVVVVVIASLAMGGLKIYLYPGAFGRNWTPVGFSYLRGYRLGIAQAREDLANRQAVIMNAVDSSEELVDRATGLHLWSMGDMTDRGTNGYVAGYNDTVHANIRANGIPSYSWKKWEGIIFNAGDYFAKRSLREPPISLHVGGSSITNALSNSVITLRPNGSGTGYLISVTANLDNWVTTWPVSPEDGELSCIWGPAGSDLLIVRGLYARSSSPVTAVLDAHRGIWLRFEH